MAVVKFVKVERSTQLIRSTIIPVRIKKIIVTAGKIYYGNSKQEAKNRKRKWEPTTTVVNYFGGRKIICYLKKS